MIHDTIRDDALKARKGVINNKEGKPLSNVLTSLVGDLDAKAKDLRIETLNDEEALKILRYWAKQMLKASEIPNADEIFISASLNSKGIYESYLPEVMTRAEMKAILGVHKFSNIGNMMKFFKTYHANEYSSAQLVTLYNNEFAI